MAQKLSDLQAQLRKGPGVAAKADASTAPVQSKDGLKRPAQDGQGGPPKKRTLASPGKATPSKAAIVKQPAGGKGKPAPGLSAKVASPGSASPTPSGLGEDMIPVATTTTAKTSMPVPFQKAPMAQVSAPPAKRAPPAQVEKRPSLGSLDSPQESTLTLTPASIDELVSAIEASPPSAKQRHAVQLAEAVGQSLPIEHINMFLRALKGKIVERAQADGVQVPRVAAPGPDTGSVPKAGQANSAPKSGAATPKSLPPTTPSGKVVLAKATLSKSAGFIAKVGAMSSPAGTPPTVVPPKASVAKVPPAKTAGSLAKAVVKAKAVPPREDAAPESTSKASPPASPAAEAPSDGDALYQLVGELTDDPVVQDGIILEDRINQVFRRLWEGAARKPKDWVAAWQAMGIPADRQMEALQKFLNIAFVQTEDPDKAPVILAELVKGHKLKMRAVEDVFVAFGQNLDGILAINEEAWQVYSKFLVHVFPKPAIEGWGWSRVGWDWKGWWQFCERCVQSLEASRAFDVLGQVLRLLQDREGTPLYQVQAWTDGDRFAKFLAKLCDLGGCELPEVVERLSLLGVNASEE